MCVFCAGESLHAPAAAWHLSVSKLPVLVPPLPSFEVTFQGHKSTTHGYRRSNHVASVHAALMSGLIRIERSTVVTRGFESYRKMLNDIWVRFVLVKIIISLFKNCRSRRWLVIIWYKAICAVWFSVGLDKAWGDCRSFLN